MLSSIVSFLVEVEKPHGSYLKMKQCHLYPNNGVFLDEVQISLCISLNMLHVTWFQSNKVLYKAPYLIWMHHGCIYFKHLYVNSPWFYVNYT